MGAYLATTTGTPTTGAEILRERARWAAAEHRWQPPYGAPPPDCPAPPTLSPGRQALWNGAVLSEFRQAAVARSGHAA